MGKKKKKKFGKKGLPPGSLIYTGDRSEIASSVCSVWFNEAEFLQENSYMPGWQQNQDGLTWIDVLGLTDTKLVETIGHDFQLHHLALEDVLNTQQRSKLEEYDDSLFFILHNLRLEPETLELHNEQIAVFMGKNFVVSFQEDADDTLQNVRTRAFEALGRLRKRGADYLLYAILDTIVDHYYTLLDDIESVLHDLETHLHNNGADEQLKARIFDLKRIVNQFRHRIMPLREAVNRLYRSDCINIDEINRPYLRDLMDHVSQVFDNVDNAREQLAGVEALYQAEIGNRLNNVMRLLTIISTIFIPLSFIAGLYGMNFEHMPELHWQHGYYMVLGIMFTATVSMLIYFRRNRWI